MRDQPADDHRVVHHQHTNPFARLKQSLVHRGHVVPLKDGFPSARVFPARMSLVNGFITYSFAPASSASPICSSSVFCGHHHNYQRREFRRLAQALEQLQPVHLGHVPIQQNQSHRCILRLDHIQCFSSVCSFENFESELPRESWRESFEWFSSRPLPVLSASLHPRSLTECCGAARRMLSSRLAATRERCSIRT